MLRTFAPPHARRGRSGLVRAARVRWRPMAGDPRSVMVFAAPADPQRREQLDALAFDGAAAARRDVLVVDVADRLDALALCDLYDVSPGTFTVLLIGRDGTEQERWLAPVQTRELWDLIDAEE
jgi:hypothetical protein